MTSLRWKLNRLRAMDTREVLHRGSRFLSQQVEKKRVTAGWQPQPGKPVGHKLFLFDTEHDWLDDWNSNFQLDDEKLNELSTGKIDLFSHQSLDIGQPVNWLRDPLTGKQTPLVFGKTLDYRDDTQVGDIKVVWELGRHQHLVPLAVAYACSGKPEYRDTVIAQIEGWVANNPFGMGIHWCSALELGLRLVSWAIAHSMLKLRGHEGGLFSLIGKPEQLGLSIYQQAWFIRHFLSRHSSANNHLIGELAGLWVASQVFDLGSQGQQWAAFAQQELEEQAGAQTYPDGVNKEQAIYYHLWVLEYLLFTWLVGERSRQPFSSAYRQRIESMSDFLEDVSATNGEPPQIGDADNGFVARFEPTWPVHPYRDVQDAVRRVFGNDQPASNPVSPKGFWYAMIAPAPRSESVSPGAIRKRQLPIVYEHGGYAVLGDDKIRIVFDAGQLGYLSTAAHGHADALSFCLAIDGDWWLVDPGTYAYHSEADWRDYFRGTAAHNTICLNRQNQSQIGGAFLWMERAHAEFESISNKDEGQQCVQGKHDGYKALGAVHRRKICFNSAEGVAKISDVIESNSAQTLSSAYVHFHFAPNIDVTLQDHTLKAVRPGSTHTLRMTLDARCDWTVCSGQTAPILGWYSAKIGEKVPASTLTGNCQDVLPGEVVTRIEVS